MNIPEITEKIASLYNTLKSSGDSTDNIVKKINDILIFGEKVPLNILEAAWDFFANARGVVN